MEIFKDRIFAEIRERFEKLGIKAVLFDLDDTLIYTSEIFARYMDEYVRAIVDATGIEYKTIDDSLRRVNDEMYKTKGVNPNRWSDTVQGMKSEFPGHEDIIVDNLDILMKIYSEKPRIRSGARAILDVLRSADIKVGLVTHANSDWTWMKLASIGLIDYFDSILIADENGHKGVEHWKSIMADLEVTPQECLVLGDSLGGDIIPTAQIGCRTIWLHKGSTWSMYRTGEVPEGTLVIDEVSALLSALDQLR